ncbi:MAG: hypothetical protein ABI374_05990 [Ginsengibacter sp.]
MGDSISFNLRVMGGGNVTTGNRNGDLLIIHFSYKECYTSAI